MNESFTFLNQERIPTLPKKKKKKGFSNTVNVGFAASFSFGEFILTSGELWTPGAVFTKCYQVFIKCLVYSNRLVTAFKVQYLRID